MLNIQENLENILPYRPKWSEVEKTAYTDNLKYINAHHDKLLKVHNDIIEDSIYKFDYLTDVLAEFIASYMRDKIKNEKFEAIREIKEDLKEIKDTLNKMQENIDVLENNVLNKY